MGHLDLARYLACAQHDSRKVNGKKPVAAQAAGQGVGDYGHGEQENGLGAIRCGAGALREPSGKPADGQAETDTEDDLLREQHRNDDASAGGKSREHGREHVGDGVVGARLDLEKGVCAVAQREAVLTKHAEDARRVRGRHDGAKQQAADPVHAQSKVRKDAGNTGGQDHADRGKEYRRHRHRPGSLDICVEAAIEHDEQKGRAADAFGERVVAEVDMRGAVDPKQHAEGDEYQQGWRRELGPQRL